MTPMAETDEKSKIKLEEVAEEKQFEVIAPDESKSDFSTASDATNQSPESSKESKADPAKPQSDIEKFADVFGCMNIIGVAFLVVLISMGVIWSISNSVITGLSTGIWHFQDFKLHEIDWKWILWGIMSVVSVVRNPKTAEEVFGKQAVQEFISIVTLKFLRREKQNPQPEND